MVFNLIEGNFLDNRTLTWKKITRSNNQINKVKMIDQTVMYILFSILSYTVI